MIVLILNWLLKGAIFSSYYNLVTFVLLNLLVLNLIICVSSFNIIHSILFLILSFFCLSSIFFILNLKFIGILIILIYGGALSILLLFVLMILDVKFLLFDVRISYKYCLMLLIFSIVLQFLIIIFSKKSLVYYPLYIYIDWMKILFMQDEMVVLGDLLYNKSVLPLLIIGIILLSVLIGSISMVSTKKSSYRYLVVNQLKSDKKRLYYFNKKI